MATFKVIGRKTLSEMIGGDWCGELPINLGLRRNYSKSSPGARATRAGMPHIDLIYYQNTSLWSLSTMPPALLINHLGNTCLNSFRNYSL